MDFISAITKKENKYSQSDLDKIYTSNINPNTSICSCSPACLFTVVTDFYSALETLNSTAFDGVYVTYEENNGLHCEDFLHLYYRLGISSPIFLLLPLNNTTSSSAINSLSYSLIDEKQQKNVGKIIEKVARACDCGSIINQTSCPNFLNPDEYLHIFHNKQSIDDSIIKQENSSESSNPPENFSSSSSSLQYTLEPQMRDYDPLIINHSKKLAKNEKLWEREEEKIIKSANDNSISNYISPKNFIIEKKLVFIANYIVGVFKIPFNENDLLNSIKKIISINVNKSLTSLFYSITTNLEKNYPSLNSYNNSSTIDDQSFESNQFHNIFDQSTDSSTNRYINSNTFTSSQAIYNGLHEDSLAESEYLDPNFHIEDFLKFSQNDSIDFLLPYLCDENAENDQYYNLSNQFNSANISNHNNLPHGQIYTTQFNPSISPHHFNQSPINIQPQINYNENSHSPNHYSSHSNSPLNMNELNHSPHHFTHSPHHFNDINQHQINLQNSSLHPNQPYYPSQPTHPTGENGFNQY